MQQTVYHIIVIVIVIISVAVGILYKTVSEKSHVQTPIVVTVTRTDTGFHPANIYVPVGTTVVFTASTSNPTFWPASDSHPSHGIYPDFDPQQPIPNHENWSFTFDTIGSWSYHDHLYPTLAGEVVVHNQYGQSTLDCLNTTTENEGKMQAACWIQEFTEYYEHDDLDQVFTQFDAYLESDDPIFKRNCHDILHEIGDLAYTDYLSHGILIDRPETAYCGYGFYHGFIEKMFHVEGDYARSREYCEALAESDGFVNQTLALDAMFACQHGMGHAIFDSIDGNLWGDDIAMTTAALTQCERIFSNPKAQVQCSTGVSNALSIAYGNYYNLEFSTEDIYKVCKIIADEYKAGCYMEVMNYYTSEARIKPSEVFAMIEEQMDDFVQAQVIEAYASNEVEWFTTYSHQNIKKTMDICYLLEAGQLRESCMSGIHFGIYKKNTPYTNMQESEAVCALYEKEEERDFCKKFIWNKLR